MSLIVNCKSQNTQYWNRNELTVAYFDDIKKYPVLSIEEERVLLELYHNGNDEESKYALHKLVECNQRFVVSVARRWSTTENLMDIVNEGNVGLIKAIECFNMDKKQRLITYAVFWIRKYINNYLSSVERSIKPINAHKVYTYVNKIVNRFFAENGRNPYPEEIREILLTKYNIVLNNLDDLTPYTITSIHSKGVNNDNENHTFEEIGEYAITTSSNNIYDDIQHMSNKIIINEALSILKEREKDIIKRYYGIGCLEENLEVIADRHSITKERCRQIIKSVITNLRKKLLDKNLK